MILHPRQVLHGIGNDLVVIPGSFNPVHNGHREVFRFCANNIPGNPIIAEISQTHMFKPNIEQKDLENRMQLLPPATTLITQKPKTEEKFDLICKYVPNLESVVFVYGADVYKHILNTPSTVEFFINEPRAELLIIPRGGITYADVNSDLVSCQRFVLFNHNFEDPTLASYPWEYQHLSSTIKRNSKFDYFDSISARICQRLPDKGISLPIEPEMTLGDLVYGLDQHVKDQIITSIQVDLEVASGIRFKTELSEETKLSQL